MTHSLKTLLLTAAGAGLMSGAGMAQPAPAPVSGAAGAWSAEPAGKLPIAYAAQDSAPDKHACKGKNSCKGKGGCSSGDNGCKGKNSCKSKGGCQSAGSM